MDTDILAEGFGIAEGLSPAETKKAKKLMKQYDEIIEHCKQGSVKLIKIFIDDDCVCFPLFTNDNLESILNRWSKIYPIEAKAIVEEFQFFVDDNPSGFGNNLKWNCRVPALVYYACKELDKNFWINNNSEQVKKYRELCPLLSTKPNKNNRTVL